MKRYYKYRRPHQYRQKKSVLGSGFFWLGALAVLFLFSIFYFLFFSQTFQVKKIIVSGERKISAEEIKSLVPQKNIFLTDTGKIEEEILGRFPQIASLKVSRSFFDAIAVAVIEREGVAVWCQAENCFLLDKEGVIFEAASLNADLLKIESAAPVDGPNPGKSVIVKEKLARILEIKSKLAEVAEVSAVSALLASEDRLNIKTSEGWEAYFNLKGDLDWQIRELGVILEKETPPDCALARAEGRLEYIDLRFTRVYCK